MKLILLFFTSVCLNNVVGLDANKVEKCVKMPFNIIPNNTIEKIENSIDFNAETFRHEVVRDKSLGIVFTAQPQLHRQDGAVFNLTATIRLLPGETRIAGRRYDAEMRMSFESTHAEFRQVGMLVVLLEADDAAEDHPAHEAILNLDVISPWVVDLPFTSTWAHRGMSSRVRTYSVMAATEYGSDPATEKCVRWTVAAEPMRVKPAFIDDIRYVSGLTNAQRHETVADVYADLIDIRDNTTEITTTATPAKGSTSTTPELTTTDEPTSATTMAAKEETTSTETPIKTFSTTVASPTESEASRVPVTPATRPNPQFFSLSRRLNISLSCRTCMHLELTVEASKKRR